MHHERAFHRVFYLQSMFRCVGTSVFLVLRLTHALSGRYFIIGGCQPATTINPDDATESRYYLPNCRVIIVNNADCSFHDICSLIFHTMSSLPPGAAMWT